MKCTCGVQMQSSTRYRRCAQAMQPRQPSERKARAYLKLKVIDGVAKLTAVRARMSAWGRRQVVPQRVPKPAGATQPHRRETTCPNTGRVSTSGLHARRRPSNPSARATEQARQHARDDDNLRRDPTMTYSTHACKRTSHAMCTRVGRTCYRVMHAKLAAHRAGLLAERDEACQQVRCGIRD